MVSKEAAGETEYRSVFYYLERPEEWYDLPAEVRARLVQLGREKIDQANLVLKQLTGESEEAFEDASRKSS